MALSDSVPGGLQPTDVQPDGVAGAHLKQAGDTGSTAFDTRRLDSRAPKFHATWVPDGRHEVHYFARIANAGGDLAAPALAELMYGEATRARTSGIRMHLEDAGL